MMNHKSNILWWWWWWWWWWPPSSRPCQRAGWEWRGPDRAGLAGPLWTPAKSNCWIRFNLIMQLWTPAKLHFNTLLYSVTWITAKFNLRRQKSNPKWEVLVVTSSPRWRWWQWEVLGSIQRGSSGSKRCEASLLEGGSRSQQVAQPVKSTPSTRTTPSPLSTPSTPSRAAIARWSQPVPACTRRSAWQRMTTHYKAWQSMKMIQSMKMMMMMTCARL